MKDATKVMANVVGPRIPPSKTSQDYKLQRINIFIFTNEYNYRGIREVVGSSRLYSSAYQMEASLVFHCDRVLHFPCC